MKKDKKIGFFRKRGLAISDFRIYPYILKTESLAKSIANFALFMMIITIIISISVTLNSIDNFDAMMKKYDNAIPEFTLTDGVLEIESGEVRIIKNDFVAIIDTKYKYNECVNAEEYDNYDRYKNKLFINSDAITLENFLGSNATEIESEPIVSQLLLKDIDENYTKDSFFDAIVMMKDRVAVKIITFLVVLMVFFLAYTLSKIFEILLYAVMASLVAAISGMKLSFKNYVKMAMYIVTLPYILEMISFLYVGTLTEATFFISNILAYVYIFYAVRAVKLDAFLIIMNNKSKKGKNIKLETDEKDVTENNVSKEKTEESKDDATSEEDKKENDEDDLKK